MYQILNLFGGTLTRLLISMAGAGLVGAVATWWMGDDDNSFKQHCQIAIQELTDRRTAEVTAAQDSAELSEIRLAEFQLALQEQYNLERNLRDEIDSLKSRQNEQRTTIEHKTLVECADEVMPQCVLDIFSDLNARLREHGQEAANLDGSDDQ